MSSLVVGWLYGGTVVRLGGKLPEKATPFPEFPLALCFPPSLKLARCLIATSDHHRTHRISTWFDSDRIQQLSVVTGHWSYASMHGDKHERGCLDMVTNTAAGGALL